MHEGARAHRLGVAGSPGVAEDVIVARDTLISRETCKPFHIAHVSTAMSLDVIRLRVRRCARRGRRSVRGFRAASFAVDHRRARQRLPRRRERSISPLRAEDDAAALSRRGPRRCTIDAASATYHAPHTRSEKARLLAEAPVGFTGLEIALGAYALALPDLPLDRFVALLSTNPARILNVAGGTLRVGAQADITVFGDREWTVDATRFYSLGRNTPFDGWRLPRRAIATIVGGRVIMRDGVVATQTAAR